LLASPAAAHDFWAGVKDSSDSRPTFFIGYGHAFPAGEAIPAEDIERYDPVKVIGPSGEVALVMGAEAFAFAPAEALPEGTYVVLTSSKSGFGSRTPDGWARQSKAQNPAAANCVFGGSYGKATVNVGPAGDGRPATEPVGQKLEIVPQVSPVGLRVDQPFPVKILFEGQPLPRAQVGAFFAGMTENNSALAFSASTDKDGLVEIIPLRSGQWLAKVNKSDPYPDQAVCDKESYNATLAFTVID
jgi:uncharacterized GH25 family protein